MAEMIEDIADNHYKYNLRTFVIVTNDYSAFLPIEMMPIMIVPIAEIADTPRAARRHLLA